MCACACNRWLLNQVLERNEVTAEEKARLDVLQQEQATASRTQVNQKRKARISVLFTEFERLKVMILCVHQNKEIYTGVLPTFQVFVKKLQHEKPMVHLLHVEMVALVRELLSKFMKPEAIPLSVKEILKVDVQSRDLQLSNKRLCVGRFCYSAMNKARVERKIWVGNLYKSLREGYIKSAEFLLKNLPLDNKTITSLSALTPCLIQCDSVCGAFMALEEALPHVVPSEEVGQLEEEVRAYQIDSDLIPQAKTYVEEDSRVNIDWWKLVV
ncbi:uncharacterized protein [Misgurnus anguillicaudatus]|uniref:uncharacterized protein n=1 Tax=Misgurnus anguillicaudatus TaxID=75329 RepID=UPI003CCF1ACB